jgi:hypothetical protein
VIKDVRNQIKKAADPDAWYPANYIVQTADQDIERHRI